MLVVQILLSIGVGLIATALFGWALDRNSDEGKAGAISPPQAAAR